MKNFKFFFKMYLLAVSMFVVSCTKTESEDLNDAKAANEYQ